MVHSDFCFVLHVLCDVASLHDLMLRRDAGGRPLDLPRADN
jgi:hypothetical protein